MHDTVVQLAGSEVFVSYVIVMAGILVLARFWSWVARVYQQGLQTHLRSCGECGHKVSKHALLCPGCGELRNAEALADQLRS